MSAYGWKASIGFIGPPRTNETVLHEAIRLAPPGISWCWSTMCLPEFGQYEFDEALALATKCAKELAARDVSVIVATGIPLITSKGVGYHRQLEREIAEAIGHRKPVTSDIACVIEALKALKLERIVLTSIYQRYIQDNVISYLDAFGICTLADEGLNFALADCMTRPTMDTAYEVAVGAHRKAPQADGLFIACPQWPVIGHIERLERELGKPVVTHIGAILWGALTRIGVSAPVQGYGRLLSKWPEPVIPNSELQHA
jgi:maleate cis-trans isomerase